MAAMSVFHVKLAVAVFFVSLSLFSAAVFAKEICGDPEDNAEALVNGANDVVVVRQANGDLKSTPLDVRLFF